MGNRGWAATGATAALAGLALMLTACGSSGSNTNAGAAYSGSGMGASPSSSAMAGPTATLTIKATSIGQVLTNARGDTLYWYAKDTKDGPSTCTGSCASAWPMVAGPAVAASGVKLAGELGTVTDAGGARQATYNGYPLYTYAGDKTPGQTTGNGEGGVWHDITGSALTAAAGMSSPSATRSATSSGGGYGYGSGVPVGSGAASGRPAKASPAKATTAPAPAAPAPTAPAPTTPAPSSAPSSVPSPGSTVYGGCGEGACW
jgi:predicted lipoprotein with Yx(FWY)xxD motif